MSNMIFGNDNMLLTAQLSIVSGTADAQFPLDNVKHPFTTKVFRSTGASCSILIDLQSTQAVDLICIKGSSVDGLGFSTATIEGSASPVFSGTPVSIDINTINAFAFKEMSSLSLRYWRLVLTGSSYVELSNIYIGVKTQMATNNLNIGFSYTSNTNNKVTKNNYGQKFVDTYNSIKTISGDVKYVNSTEYDTLNDIHVAHAENTPLWFILDSDNSIGVTDSKYMFSGMFYMKDLVWKNIAPGLWDVNINLDEAV
jgi:hypothetical protein